MGDQSLKTRAFRFDRRLSCLTRFLQNPPAAHCRPRWAVLSFVTSLYGNAGTKFLDKSRAGPSSIASSYLNKCENKPFRAVSWTTTSPGLAGFLMRGGSADGLGCFYWRTFNSHRLVWAALFRDRLDPHGTPDFGRFIDCVDYSDICQSFAA